MNGQGKKFAVGLLLAALLLPAAGAAFAHGGRHRGECDGAGGKYSGRILSRLGVTGDQKAQIQTVLEKRRTEAEPLARQAVTERKALRRLIRGGAADDAAIRSQSARVASLESDLAVVRARAAKEVRSLLTAEQIAKLSVWEAKREEKADRHIERRFRGGEKEKQ